MGSVIAMAVSPVTIPIRSIHLSPGSHLLIENISWQQYESILEDLGEKRSGCRINYSKSTLEIMSPLPIHERPHRIIGYIVTTILDFQNRDWEDFGSTTFKRVNQAGVEPETCFYISNSIDVRSLQRIDLEIHPPPDLAIETDVTSKTTLEAYAAIKVPELWIFANSQLKIYILAPDGYIESQISPIFPNLDIAQMIPQLVTVAFHQGTRQMLKKLRDFLSNHCA